MPILAVAALCGMLAAMPNERELAAGTSLQICNQTSAAISVAVSYVSRGEKPRLPGQSELLGRLVALSRDAAA
jgi:hypothetical protein